MNEVYEPLLDFFKGAKDQKILIVTHRDPDGDGLPACMALAAFLESISIQSCVWIPQGIPDYLKFLIESRSIKQNYPHYFKYTAVIALDCSAFERVPESHLIKDVEWLINIDHHQDNQSFGKINILEQRSSVGEILTHFFLSINYPIPKQVANYLYTALLYDTGQFRHSNTSSSTLKLAAALLEAGAESLLITQKLFEEKSTAYYQVLKTALDQAIFDNEFGIVYTSLNEEDMIEKISVVDLFRQWNQCKVAMVFQEVTKNEIKISLRSESENVAQFARRFGGGGHRKAAGIRLMCSMKEAIDSVVKSLKEYLK